MVQDIERAPPVRLSLVQVLCTNPTLICRHRRTSSRATPRHLHAEPMKPPSRRLLRLLPPFEVPTWPTLVSFQQDLLRLEAATRHLPVRPTARPRRPPVGVTLAVTQNTRPRLRLPLSHISLTYPICISTTGTLRWTNSTSRARRPTTT